LTEEAIKEGFSKLVDSTKYDNLYKAGSARAIGDWMLGMNATRLFTVKFGRGKATFSIGRVQTPTLSMIVQRHKEIEAFVTDEYWELKTTYRETEFTATIDRIRSKEKAEKGLEYLKQHKHDPTKNAQEEPSFTNNFSEKMAQLDPDKTIICISHSSNTFDKKKLLSQQNNTIMRKLNKMIKDKKYLDFLSTLELKQKEQSIP
jgi:DNA topoisomerase IA